MNFSKYLLYTWVGFQGIRSWKTVFDYCLIVNNGYYITKVFFFFLFVKVDLCVCDRDRFSSSKSFSYTVIINERKSGIQYCYIFQKLFLTFHWIHLQILIIHSLVQYSFINNINLIYNSYFMNRIILHKNCIFIYQWYLIEFLDFILKKII